MIFFRWSIALSDCILWCITCPKKSVLSGKEKYILGCLGFMSDLNLSHLSVFVCVNEAVTCAIWWAQLSRSRCRSVKSYSLPVYICTCVSVCFCVWVCVYVCEFVPVCATLVLLHWSGRPHLSAPWDSCTPPRGLRQHACPSLCAIFLISVFTCAHLLSFSSMHSVALFFLCVCVCVFFFLTATQSKNSHSVIPPAQHLSQIALSFLIKPCLPQLS